MTTLWIAPSHPLVPDALKGTGRVLVLVWRLRPSFMKGVYERAREAEAPHWTEDLTQLGESCFNEWQGFTLAIACPIAYYDGLLL